jgi:hypothetical protein
MKIKTLIEKKDNLPLRDLFVHSNQREREMQTGTGNEYNIEINRKLCSAPCV